MLYSEQQIGPPSEKTNQNIRNAHVWEWTWGESRWFFSWRIMIWNWWPSHDDVMCEWWVLRDTMKVRYRRWYWLWFGLACVSPHKEENND